MAATAPSRAPARREAPPAGRRRALERARVERAPGSVYVALAVLLAAFWAGVGYLVWALVG